MNSSVFCFLGLIMKKNSTLDELFLDGDSSYALSSNIEELLGGTRLLGVPGQTTQTCWHSEPTITLHHLQHQRFARSKTTLIPSVDHTWQANLVEMQHPKLVQNNHCTRYLLTVDVLSKYAWLVAVTSALT